MATPVIVMVCDVAQLFSVKVSGSDTVALVSSLLVGVTVTSPVGAASNTTV